MGAKPKIVPRLVIIEGKDKGKMIPLSDGTAVIGRTKGDVVIQDSRVSRSHVAIHYDEKTGKLSFTDLKSLNGTMLNGMAAESGDLDDGDQLQLGNTTFDCQIGPPVDQESSVNKVRESLRRRRETGSSLEQEISEIESGSLSEESQSSFDEEPALMPMMEEDEIREEPKFVEAKKSSKKKTKLAKPKKFSLAFLRKKEKTEKKTKPPKETGRSGKLRKMLTAAAIVTVVYWGLGQLGGGTNSQLENGLQQVKTLASGGTLEQAIEKAIELTQEYPDNSKPFMILGLLYALQQKNEDAIRSYQTAKTLSPFPILVHGRLVELYIKTGLKQKIPDELNAIDELIRTGKHSPELFVETGSLMLKYKADLGKPPEDFLIIAKALQKEFAPNNPLGYKLEAEALIDQKSPAEAITALEQALALDPKDEAALEKLAFAKLSAKDMDGAKETLKTWVAVNPSSSKALLVLAYLGFNENPDLALPFLQRIMQNAQKNPSDPHLPEAIYLMGQVLYRKGNKAQSQDLFQQSCSGGYEPACKMELAVKSEGTRDGAIPDSPPATEAEPTENGAPPGSRP